MILHNPHSLAAPRDRCTQSGHTLIELLVTLALVAMCATLPISGLVSALEQQSNRNNALVFQAAAVAAQMHTLGSASGCSVAWDGGSLTLTPDMPEGSALLAVDAKGKSSANVSRWRRGTGVRILFQSATASPDSAGSVYFGDPENGQRVVVRLESGLTRRASQW